MKTCVPSCFITIHYKYWTLSRSLYLIIHLWFLLVRRSYSKKCHEKYQVGWDTCYMKVMLYSFFSRNFSKYFEIHNQNTFNVVILRTIVLGVCCYLLTLFFFCNCQKCWINNLIILWLVRCKSIESTNETLQSRWLDSNIFFYNIQVLKLCASKYVYVWFTDFNSSCKDFTKFLDNFVFYR